MALVAQDRVVVRSSLSHVVAKGANDSIQTSSTVHVAVCSLVRAAVHDVVASFAIKQINAQPAEDHIVTATTDDGVAAGAPVKDVVVALAGDQVIVLLAKN